MTELYLGLYGCMKWNDQNDVNINIALALVGSLR